MVNQQQLAEDLFAEALDHPAADRPAFLDQHCPAADPALRSAVLALLAEADQAGSFLASPALTPLPPPPPAAIARFAPGDLLAARFRIVRFLAHGGMGEVYEVEDHLLQGEHVALKTIRAGIAHDPATTALFEQEVLLARKVHHPNLCPIYELFRCEDPAPPFLFLTMKLLVGETLDLALRHRHTLSRADLLDISNRLLAAVAALHAAGIIHRDIKPRNIMIARAPAPATTPATRPATPRRLRVTLLDFGLARLHAAEATVLRTGLVAGTPGYLAPELLLGQRPTRATDLFALGVVLHQLLTGVLPTESPNGLTVTPSPLLLDANAPPHLLHAVQALLSPDPDDRGRAFRALRTAHRSVPPGPPATAPPPARRPLSRRAFLTTAACALATTAGWQHTWLGNQLDDHLHPLPEKRFVALLCWPETADITLRPLLLGLLDSIATELSRAEASDHNLLVLAHSTVQPTTSTPTLLPSSAPAPSDPPAATLLHVRQTFGANLVLAASGQRDGPNLNLTFHVLDSTSGHTLRARRLTLPASAGLTFPEHAVRAAADLLSIHRFTPDPQRLQPGTDLPEALSAFQTAEAFIQQLNDTGLAPAITSYLRATALDPHFALAFSKLAQAYGRSFTLTHDPGALHLAFSNADHALAVGPRVVAAHVARAGLLSATGQSEAALAQIGTALGIDPTDPALLLWQARTLALLNRWPEAERAFRRVLLDRPNFWVIWNAFGAGLHAQGRSREAVDAFRAANVAAPGNAIVASNLGNELLAIGNVTEATQHLQHSLDLRPGYDLAAANLSLALRFQRKPAEALPFALLATRSNPSEDSNWLELADCYTALPHREHDAHAALLRALATATGNLQTAPGNGPGHLLLALYQALLADRPASTASLARAAALHTDDLDSAVVRIRTLELLGRRDDAFAALRDALARGATPFQLPPCPELDRLRADPRFRALHPPGSRS